jgi:citronellol/citronellal dehydrogenase
VAGEIGQDGGTADLETCNIRVEDAVQDAIAAILARHGPVRHLVNNAGGQFQALLEDINQKGWEAVVQTNLTGGFLTSRELYTQSMRETGGAIVNIIADFWLSMPRMGHSGAARAGMMNFTETAALEWGRDGVRVNAVAPGWVISSGFDTYDPEYTKRFRILHNYVPLGRLGEEAEVSAAVAFLLSPAAAFITGSCIRVDGGVPNARNYHEMPDGPGSEPYQGFHRAVAPKALTEPE